MSGNINLTNFVVCLTSNFEQILVKVRSQLGIQSEYLSSFNEMFDEIIIFHKYLIYKTKFVVLKCKNAKNAICFQKRQHSGPE